MARAARRSSPWEKKCLQPHAAAAPAHSRTPAGSCSPTEKHNLWEVPLWSVADEGGQPIASMDPPGNAYDNYKREVNILMLCISGIDATSGR